MRILALIGFIFLASCGYAQTKEPILIEDIDESDFLLSIQFAHIEGNEEESGRQQKEQYAFFKELKLPL